MCKDVRFRHSLVPGINGYVLNFRTVMQKCRNADPKNALSSSTTGTKSELHEQWA